MKVFLSHSGPRSVAVALALRDWLPSVINAVEPWISVHDVDKGANWSASIAEELQASSIGILCLTPENVNERWVLFEAGALSKAVDRVCVCSYLFGLDPIDLEWPLAMFQATKAERDDTLKLVHTLNRALGRESRQDVFIDKAFEVWWPHLERELKTVPAPSVQVPSRRSELELLQEILSLQRRQLMEKRESEMLHRIHTIRAVMTDIVESPQVGVDDPETQSRVRMLQREIDEANQAFRSLLDHLEKKGYRTSSPLPDLLIQPTDDKKLLP